MNVFLVVIGLMLMVFGFIGMFFCIFEKAGLWVLKQFNISEDQLVAFFFPD